jgi:hypothetical protein
MARLGTRWRAVLVAALAVVLLTTPVAVGFAAAESNNNGTVQPQYITDGRLEFSPSRTNPLKWVSVNGWLSYTAAVGISYEYYDELVDGRLVQPSVTSTNLSPISFKYESYNSYLGGPAWRARKGFWVCGSSTAYLNASTRATATGTYKAKLGGGPGYIPNPYPCSAWLYVIN